MPIKRSGLFIKRIALTAVALWGLGVLLYLFEQGLFLSKPLPDRAALLSELMVNDEPEDGQVDHRKGLRFPAFPSSKRIRSNPMEVNGILVNSETFETTAPRRAVLDFYIEQMTARGWKDVTDEVHNSSPNMLATAPQGSGLQQQHSLAVLDNIEDSELILHGGDNMMHIKIKEGRSSWLMEATVVVSSTRSVEEMGSIIDVGIESNLPRRGMKKFMDVTEYGDNGTYRTQQWLTREDPETVFTRMSNQMHIEGWKAVIPDLTVPEADEYYGTYMRKEAYAVLAVTEQESINGAMASLSVSQ